MVVMAIAAFDMREGTLSGIITLVMIYNVGIDLSQASLHKARYERECRYHQRDDRCGGAYRGTDDESCQRKDNNDEDDERDRAEKVYDHIYRFHQPTRQREDTALIAANKYNAERQTQNKCKDCCDHCYIEGFPDGKRNIAFEKLKRIAELFRRKHI